MEQIVNLAPLFPELWDKNPWVIAKIMFSKNWHFLPENVTKDRKFYELILVDTASIMVKHHLKDPKNGPPIKDRDKTHSTFQIEKILSLRDWDMALFEKKKLFIP